MTPNDRQLGPYRSLQKKTGFNFIRYILFTMALAALTVGLWALAAPDSLAKYYDRYFGRPLQINGLVISLDGKPLIIAPGNTVQAYPGQKLSIGPLLTNRWRNYDLRLYSPDFDVDTVMNGQKNSFLSLLGEKAFYEPKLIYLEAKEGSSLKAVFTIRAAFTSLDLTAKGDVEKDQFRKAELYERALAAEPDSRPIRDKLAAALIESEQKERAVELLENNLTKYGLDQETLNRLLDLYKALGQPQNQIETLNRLIKLANDRGWPKTDYLKQLGGLYKNNKQPLKAAGIYEELLATAENNQKVVYLDELTSLYRASLQTGKEIDAWKRLLPLAHESRVPAIWSEIINIYEKSGHEEGQRSAWRSLAEALPAGSNKANAYKKLGLLCAKAEKYDEAEAAFKTAVELDPKDVNVYLNLARLAENKGDRLAYQSYLEKVLELEPGRSEPRMELAEIYEISGLSDKAKSEYKKLLDVDPGNQAARLKMIAILEKEGNQESLIAEYEKLLTQTPNDKVAVYNFGVLCFQEKQWDRAIAAFKKVIELDKTDPEAHAYLLAVYKEKGQTDDMLAQALELYRLDQSQKEYLELLVNHYSNARKWDELAKVATEVARLTPESPEGWNLLAKAQTGLNQKAEAAQSLLIAARKSGELPESPKAEQLSMWLAAASALAETGASVEAQKAYQKVLEIDPENKKAAEDLMALNLKELNKKK